jgi:hypothetical protein
MFDAWQRATVPRVVVAVFAAAGFVPLERDGQIFLEIGRSKATRVHHWSEAPHTLPPFISTDSDASF